jgi:hypothetical protein
VDKLKDLICLSVALVFDVVERMPWNIGIEWTMEYYVHSYYLSSWSKISWPYSLCNRHVCLRFDRAHVPQCVLNMLIAWINSVRIWHWAYGIYHGPWLITMFNISIGCTCMWPELNICLPFDICFSFS